MWVGIYTLNFLQVISKQFHVRLICATVILLYQKEPSGQPSGLLALHGSQQQRLCHPADTSGIGQKRPRFPPGMTSEQVCVHV